MGNQYAAYTMFGGAPAAGEWWLQLNTGVWPYGILTVPIALGETVEWVDAIMYVEPQASGWDPTGSTVITAGDPLMRSQPPNTPVVVLAVDEVPFANWPHLEGFVQDGRYTYAGAFTRAHGDIIQFSEPLVSYEWDTTDPNAAPGRLQALSFIGPTFPAAPPVLALVTILSVDITFPLPTLPPRRHCVGGGRCNRRVLSI